MPVHRGKDTTGTFYQWGGHGKKYYYATGNAAARQVAYERAALQGRAVEWRKHSGGSRARKR